MIGRDPYRAPADPCAGTGACATADTRASFPTLPPAAAVAFAALARLRLYGTVGILAVLHHRGRVRGRRAHSRPSPRLLGHRCHGVTAAAVPGHPAPPHVARPGPQERHGWVADLAWEASGSSRTAERVYVTAVAVALRRWLSPAIAAGPLTKPLPAIAGIATVTLATPWWAHRRRRQPHSAGPDMAEDSGAARVADSLSDRGCLGIHPRP